MAAFGSTKFWNYLYLVNRDYAFTHQSRCILDLNLGKVSPIAKSETGLQLPGNVPESLIHPGLHRWSVVPY